MPNQLKIEKCTNCGTDQIEVAGNKFLCRVCNVVYEVTDTGTKVLDANPLDRHEQRLDQAVRDIAEIKKQQGGDESEHVDQGEPPDLQEGFHDDDGDEAEDDTEQDGFIVFE